VSATFLPQTRSLLDRLVEQTVFTPIRDGSAVSETVARIGQAIALGLLPPGAQLPPEARLADDLGISTTTLRTALAILREAGHLETVRGRGGGTFVSEDAARRVELQRTELPSEAELRDFSDHRAALEAGAAELAAERATREQIGYLETLVARMASETDFAEWGKVDTLVHLALADASGSRRLLAEITDIRAEAYRLSLSVPEPRSTFDLSNDEHRAILNAVAAHRPERARQAVCEHIRSTLALWLGLGLVREERGPAARRDTDPTGQTDERSTR
jgi:DNA-binding FadR family transcriptional regulator